MNAWNSIARCACILAVTVLAPVAQCEGATDGPGGSAAPVTIVDLQQHRKTESVDLPSAIVAGAVATWTHLSPAVNSGFLLTLRWPALREPLYYHIENTDPQSQHVTLDVLNPGNLQISRAGKIIKCAFWPHIALDRARQSPLAYAPLCDGRLYLRNKVSGSRTALEATTEFLRDHVWRGEQIIGFVRREFYQDAFIEKAKSASKNSEPGLASPVLHGPRAADVVPWQSARPVAAPGLGIDVGPTDGLLPGQWYAATGQRGVYVSIAQPGLVAEVNTSKAGRPRPLDAVESVAMVFLMAFELSDFELGFALGTEHPRLNWSARARQDQVDRQLPGPDGIGSAAPLVRTGMVSPMLQPRTVASFAGGFKREHGAFRYGALAGVNRASHYGFIENGVVYSRLVPGLSTLYVLNDGFVGMKTWTRFDDRMLDQMRHARQNGVPLIEPQAGSAIPAWGSLVDAWGPGNWSGSADEKLRSLRAGACLTEQSTRRFLVYGYFSTATPRAMARVFQAYGCN